MDEEELDYGSPGGDLGGEEREVKRSPVGVVVGKEVIKDGKRKIWSRKAGGQKEG